MSPQAKMSLTMDWKTRWSTLTDGVGCEEGVQRAQVGHLPRREVRATKITFLKFVFFFSHCIKKLGNEICDDDEAN